MQSFAAFILAHEDFARSLKSTVEKIMGPQDHIFAYSNKIESLPVLLEKIVRQIEMLKQNNIFIFVDLIGGSCWSLANMIAKQQENLVIIGGVNLPMIVSLVINHDKLEKEKLVDKILEDSKKGIKLLQRNH